MMVSNTWLNNTSSLFGVGMQIPGGTGFPNIALPGGQTPSLSPQTAATRSFITAMRGFGETMRNTTSDILSRSQNVFSNLMGSSSNADAVTVSVNNQADATRLGNNTMSVGVSQLASAQQNTGTTLGARALSNVSTGTNQFTLERDGRTFNFSINVNLSDSNRTVQYRMADAINSQNTGVTASVRFDSATQTSSLVLTANESGEQSAFTIADVSGNAVSAMGAGNVTREARDAMFTVNGEQRTSTTNTVDLGNGLTANLRGTTASGAEVTVGTRRDVEGIANTIHEMVGSFNDMRQAATSLASRDRGADTLMRRLDGIASAYETSLRNIGITRGRDGRLNIDEDRLNNAIENGLAEQVLTDRMGFTNQLSRIGQSAADNPAQFVSHQARNNLNIVEPPGWNNSDQNRFMQLMSRQGARWNIAAMLFDASM
jgi:flagellar hook-associated protein 2